MHASADCNARNGTRATDRPLRAFRGHKLSWLHVVTTQARVGDRIEREALVRVALADQLLIKYFLTPVILTVIERAIRACRIFGRVLISQITIFRWFLRKVTAGRHDVIVFPKVCNYKRVKFVLSKLRLASQCVCKHFICQQAPVAAIQTRRAQAVFDGFGAAINISALALSCQHVHKP